MIPFPRRALLHALALLALAGCASTPTRPPSDTERDALAAAADGLFPALRRADLQLPVHDAVERRVGMTARGERRDGARRLWAA